MLNLKMQTGFKDHKAPTTFKLIHSLALFREFPKTLESYLN